MYFPGSIDVAVGRLAGVAGLVRGLRRLGVIAVVVLTVGLEVPPTASAVTAPISSLTGVSVLLVPLPKTSMPLTRRRWFVGALIVQYVFVVEVTLISLTFTCKFRSAIAITPGWRGTPPG